MARRDGDRRRNARPGLLAGLVGAGLLLGVGFVLGLAVGASWEDPDLLVSVVAGRAQDVPLPGAAGPGPASEGVPPPLGSRPPAVPVAPPAPVAAPPPGGFAIQVGAFRERGPADALERRLEEAGFPTYVMRADPSGAQRWRVRVGPVADRTEAERLARRLKRDEGLPTWVVRDER